METLRRRCGKFAITQKNALIYSGQNGGAWPGLIQSRSAQSRISTRILLTHDRAAAGHKAKQTTDSVTEVTFTL